jgi:hypothetical protein
VEAAARRPAAHVAARWLITPPESTAVFFGLMPPNATSSSVCSRIAVHVVLRLNISPSPARPSTCGTITSAAPSEYEFTERV